jgi:hypothetical protein
VLSLSPPLLSLFFFNNVINLAADLISPKWHTFFGAINKRNPSKFACYVASHAAWSSPAF